MKDNILDRFYKIRTAFSYGYFDGVSLGAYEKDFDKIEKIIKNHISKVQKNRQEKRQYYVRFIKSFKLSNGELYKDNSGFCIKDLHTPSLKRYFLNDNLIIFEMIVKHIPTNKIIYQGNDYATYLYTIENL